MASFLKRASRLATPAMGASAVAGVAAMVVFSANDDDRKSRVKQIGNNKNVALCHHGEDPNDTHGESVVGMLGDIRDKVRLYIK